MPVVREALVRFGALFCVFALATLAGCGGSGSEGEQEKGEQGPNQTVVESVEETTVEAAAGEGVVVRVSGTPGTAYSGTYGTISEVRAVDDDTVGNEPTDYELGAVEGEDGRLNVSFSKTQSGGETLEVEILVDGEVVSRGETSAELGVATASWTPPGALPDEVLPKEKEK